MIALFAETPALPLHAAGKFVAGAYIAFVLIILVYVAIMAKRLVSNQRELVELRRMVTERERDELADGVEDRAGADRAAADSDPVLEVTAGEDLGRARD